MRNSFSFLALLSAVAVFAVGCAGPEQKLGRGMLNVTEFTRLGEVRRSMEQTALWENTDTTYTTGLIRGINRSLVRTAGGAWGPTTFTITPLDSPN